MQILCLLICLSCTKMCQVALMTSFLFYFIYIHIFPIRINFIGTNETAILEKTNNIHKIVSFNYELKVLFMVKNHQNN